MSWRRPALAQAPVATASSTYSGESNPWQRDRKVRGRDRRSKQSNPCFGGTGHLAQAEWRSERTSQQANARGDAPARASPATRSRVRLTHALPARVGSSETNETVVVERGVPIHHTEAPRPRRLPCPSGCPPPTLTAVSPASTGGPAGHRRPPSKPAAT
uniref:Uncharacterized protein n=1 Tax=Setaria viridis TaxID=4556 RepID=A0A4U6TWV7_SETVI|nr:hypothetical protein SEVIR_7G224200v2 [Setaria viridis]